MVPLEIKDGALVPLAKAKTLHPRMKDIPNIYELVVTSTGHKITAWTELDAVDFSLVAYKLHILTHEPLRGFGLGQS